MKEVHHISTVLPIATMNNLQIRSDVKEKPNNNPKLTYFVQTLKCAIEV